MENREQGIPRKPRRLESGNWRQSQGAEGNGVYNQRRGRSSSESSEQSYSGYSRRGRGNYYRRPNGNNERSESRDLSLSSTHSSGRRFGFKGLEYLLEKDSDDLILELSNSKRGIHDFFKSNISEDTIILFVKVLKKVSDSAFIENKYKVLQLYLDETFIAKLIKYIVLLPMQTEANREKNKYFWKDTDDFWNNIIAICQDIYHSIPTFACKVLPDILNGLIMCFPSFETKHKQHISDGIKDSVNKLNESIQKMIKEEEEKKNAALQKKVCNTYEEEPPDDFRQISVYPNALELLSGCRVFLRKNVVDGPYRDVNHYLDVQFRLLREDFVGPLRSGIESYRSESTQSRRIENVKIYQKIRFLNPETINEQYCVRLKYDFSKNKRKLRYEDSKRFMFGSLLCFTSDNFKSLMFGKIAQRDAKDLEKGELIVGFDQNVVVAYDIDYLMIECSVYFEPYFHVLNVLKNMNIESFPMEKYIIRVDPTVQPPEYLNEGREIEVRAHKFSPLLNWPHSTFYNFNPSQLEAFQAALTQEFSVIQGPPGTGKTFLGLKIAKTLLENNGIWYNKTPMLVICYTNHALDQFLEGLTQFTDQILRIGGQSQNQALAAFNLRNRRFRTSPAVLQQRNEVKVILGQIRSITENLKQIEFYHSIRAFDVFEDVVPNYNRTWFCQVTKEQILEWLLSEGGNTQDTSLNNDTNDIAQIWEELGKLHIEDGEDVGHSDEASDFEDEVIDVQIDDLFDEVTAMAVQCSVPLITVSSLYIKIGALERTLDEIKRKDVITIEDIFLEDKISLELLQLKHKCDYLNFRLAQGKESQHKKKRVPRLTDLKNPYNMPPDDRWNLYFYWLDLYKATLANKLNLLNHEFREQHKIYEEMRDIQDTKSMKEVLVVGMTTTGAARLRSSLQSLKSPIVIVEEAAEILEAHIIASLTTHCKHLILIGDHQQLKPSTANYNIEKFYNLGISLFERMVLNKIQLHTLNVQHRMRPEISSLISPTIYPSLQDHPSVEDRPLIKGVDKCLYFIHHTHPETDCESTSKKNYHEVEFLIYFARHLILNGYKSENITILAAYLGQMFELQKEKKRHLDTLKDVRISVLDNYQGEECDIILLSLVRNNKENKIGFLSIENRVCVALSRARNGFYLMGNMNQLCAESELWRKIRECFERQEAIGSKLALRCQIHPDRVTYVESGKDFLDISEGGCNQRCGADLVCGHKCSSLCHFINKDHVNYQCQEKCGKKLCDNEQHLCRRVCSQECGPCNYKVLKALPCGHVLNLECHMDADLYRCEELVPTRLPCGHDVDKPCYCDPQSFRCPHPCQTQVEPCGHACMKTCHIRQDPDHLEYKCQKLCARFQKQCTADPQHLCRKFCFEECNVCMFRVKKQRTVCPHFYDVPCSMNVDEIHCEKPCTKILPCSHKCKLKCHEKCGKCDVKVNKTISACGHVVKVKCSQEPDRKLCSKKCPLQLSCGHPCTKKCNEPCTNKCRVLVDCRLKAPCGHIVTRLQCYLLSSDVIEPKTLLKYCNQLCRDQLQCGHICSGSCGECLQGRIHKRCSEKCGNPLVCNHPCEFPCRQACRPCVRPCAYKCKHSSCNKRCGDICIPCKEKCPRSCKHQRCTNLCGYLCSVPPCEVPCDKMLECGHKCIGLCGDPCPPKCLVCDKDELTEVFFGYEDEDAQYVLLQDCGHIFENTGLKHWMEQDDGGVRFKECPKCKTAIKTTHRYSDYVKQAMADVAKVKNNLHGTETEIKNKRGQLLLKTKTLNLRLEILERKINTSGPKNFSSLLRNMLSAIKNRLETSLGGKRQRINKSELNASESKLQVLEHIMNITKDKPVCTAQETVCSQVKLIIKIFGREEDYITDQEISDIQMELSRLTRIAELEEIKLSSSFTARFANSAEIQRFVQRIEVILFGFGKFYNKDEETVKRALENLSDLVASGVGISEQEKREIVKAMGFKQGHWYKCPKGHPYCIGECGGAMQEAKCPECGSVIGGTQHQLVAGNAVATEMDGARFSAWSQAANMGNYMFNFED